MITNLLPQQKLAKSQKNGDWARITIEELEKISNSDDHYGRSSKYKKQANYELFNGRLDEADFQYVLNPYGFKQGSFPANLQHYDIISPKLQLLFGEEMKRPFNYMVVNRNPDAVTEIEKKKKELLLQSLTSYIQQYINPEEQQEQQEMTPAQIEKYIKTEYRDIKEIVSQRALNYLVDEQKLKQKFNNGWKDALVAGEEIYWVGSRGGEPYVRVCNPLDITVIQEVDNEYIEDAIAVIEERWLSPSTILDEWHDELTPTEIDDIEKGFTGSHGTTFNYGAQSLFIHSEEDYRTNNRVSSVKGDGNIRVLDFEWKSMRKIGFISFEDGDEDIVGEEFKIPSEAEKLSDGSYEWFDESIEQTVTLKWEWISEVWKATKIGTDIIKGVGPKLNQRRSMENPSICKLGYVGYIYNARNSESISLIDRMKPYQYLYDIIYYRTELAFAKSKGKLALMDLSQIPASEGWDVDKWMYYLESTGVMFINSKEEGKDGQTSNFNQFTSIDLSMGNYINQHVMMLDKIKEEIGELSGVSRQRQGQVTSSELVGNTERAVTQSSHITEPWFYFHNEVKQRVLTALIDVAKIVWKKGKKINYIMDDMSRMYLEIEDGIFEDAEFGVFLSDSSKDQKIKATMEQLAQVGLQSGTLSASSIISFMQSESIQEMKRSLEASEEKVQQQEQMNQQSQQEAQMKIEQDRLAFERERMDREDARNEQNNLTKLQIAQLQADNVGIDYDKLSIQERKIEQDTELRRAELEERRRNNEMRESLEKERIAKQSKSS